MDNSNKQQNYAVLPLRDIVVFPGMIVPLFVGREKSIKALENSVESKSKLLLVTQKDALDDNPKPEDIYRTGVIVNILQLLKLPDGTVKVLVEGVSRGEVNYYLDNNEYFEAEIYEIEEPNNSPSETEALIRSVLSSFEKYIKLNKKFLTIF
jgi:ATP-dependent Lon protease